MQKEEMDFLLCGPRGHKQNPRVETTKKKVQSRPQNKFSDYMTSQLLDQAEKVI